MTKLVVSYVNRRSTAAKNDVTPFPDLIAIGNRKLPLSEFVVYCGNSLAGGDRTATDCYPDEFRRARDQFVRGGLSALAPPTHRRWLQVGIRPASSTVPHPELCGRVAELARTLLTESVIENFFFMHKPPGIRLRFELADGCTDGPPDAVYDDVARWRREGLVDQIEPGVYEPESQLFGGLRSMQYVHALFTVDSLAWLDYHACSMPQRASGGTAWVVSLAMLRTLFDGLDITGWEDLGVWDLVRNQAGRRLMPQATAVSGYTEVASAIRASWLGRGDLLNQLHPVVRPIVDDHDEALRPAVAQWRSGFFATREVSVGPRAAAAFYVIFHWNRAALPPVRQALLTESLSAWEGVG